MTALFPNEPIQIGHALEKLPDYGEVPTSLTIVGYIHQGISQGMCLYSVNQTGY